MQIIFQTIDQYIIYYYMETNHQTTIDINSVHDCNTPSSCGYCHNPKGSYTWGFSCKKMTPKLYEILMNKGWRRCGSYYYKPNLQKSCCKSYTIRMNCQTFKIKKQQKKTVKTLLSLVKEKTEKKIKKQEQKKVDKKHPKNQQNQQKQKNSKTTQKMEIEKKPEQIKKQVPLTKEQQEKNKKHSLILQNLLKNFLLILKNSPQNILNLVPLKQNTNINFGFEEGIKIFVSKDDSKGNYYTNFAMLLFGKNKNNILQKITLHDFVKKIENIIIQGLNQLNSDYKYFIQYSGYLIFKLKQVSQKIELESSEQYQVISKKSSNQLKLKDKKSSDQFIVLQNPINNQAKLSIISEEDPSWPELEITPQHIKFGLLEVDIVPVQESIQSFRLYQKYNKNIHDKKQKEMSSYTDFLCVNGLYQQIQTKNVQQEILYQSSWDQKGEHQKPVKIKGAIKKLKGCYHMKYYLLGDLIAVGVIDIVNNGMSSVYFFYDHFFKQYRLGVFSSLLEIQYVKYLNKIFPEFKYYYMGYYIQNCQKMNYKADYQPCELLCPITFTYVPVDTTLRDHIKKIIETKITAKLSSAGTSLNPDNVINGDIGLYVDQNLKLYYHNQRLILRNMDRMFSLKILFALRNIIPVLGKTAFGEIKFQINV